MTDDDLLRWLQGWYAGQCDGDWEHSYGVTIGTLDNPGWTLAVDLAETEMAAKSFDGIKWERSDDDWLVCRLEEGKFMAYCGPRGLSDAIAAFRDWVNQP